MNATANTAKPSDRTVGYDFDPAPKRARELLEQGQISRTDYLVLVELLKFRRGFRASCWTTKAKIADALAVTTKTVQRSYRHLSQAQLISLHEVSPPGCPDPNEPANRTGWRIHFLFVDAVRSNAPGPDRRTPEARRKHASKPGGEDTNVLPSQDTNVLPPQDTNVLQFRKPSGLSLDGTELDNNNETGPEPTLLLFSNPLIQDQETHPITKSREIPLADLPPAPEIDQTYASTHANVGPPAPEATVDAELVINQVLLLALMARFMVFFGKTAEQARAAVQGCFQDYREKAKGRGFRFELAWFESALNDTEKAQSAKKIKKTPWVYFLGVLDKYARQGGPDTSPCRGSATSPYEARETLAWLRSLGCDIVPNGTGGCRTVPDRESEQWKGLPEMLKRKLEQQKEAIRKEILAGAVPVETARL